MSDALVAAYVGKTQQNTELAIPLRGFIERARSERPAIALDEAAWLAWVSPRIGLSVAAIDAAPAGDLLVAWGCSLNDPAAIDALRGLLVNVRRTISRIDARADFIDDVQQNLLQRLMVSVDGAQARIVEYSGRGSLAGWLNVIAARLALDHRERAATREGQPAQAEPSLVAPMTREPELMYLQARYRDTFAAALRDAVNELEPRARTLMRLSVVDGLSGEQLARMYDVNRSTVMRWLDAAREKVLEATRTRVRSALGVDEAEFESMLQLVRSQLDISVNRLLADQ